jgi:murein DD-endopeptidase MepM/ murein hydrolase activator NlpD
MSLSFLYGSVQDINKKIKLNKKESSVISSKKSNINKIIGTLAEKINQEMVSYKNILKILEKTDNQILLNRMKLSNSITKIKKLKLKSTELNGLKIKIEKDVIDFVIEKYSMSMGIEQANKKTITDILNKEVYTLVFDNTKTEILDLNILYLKVNNSIRDNEKNISKISKYIQKQKNTKKRYKELKKIQEKSIVSLSSKHKLYQKNLKKLVNKQNNIADLLGSLNILKKQEIKSEKSRLKKAKELARKKELEKKRKKELEKKRKKISKKSNKNIKFSKRNILNKDIDIEVKKIGSSVKGVKISKYTGRKTISPLKSYTIEKKLGKYYDKVYRMELFNESVSLKTKKSNAKVFSVFKGQIVYAKQNSGLLANVVIVKHRNNLHTIYSHLDQISPTLKVGKWIPKGYVVGRVSDTLEFQATKNSKYVDPMKLIK